MEYVEHTSKVLYNLVCANSSMRALKIRLSAIFAHSLHMIDFMSHYELILCIINFLHKLKCRKYVYNDGARPRFDELAKFSIF